MWAVEIYQRIKVQLQNMAFRSRDYTYTWLRKAMNQVVTTLPELLAADSEVSILTMVSLKERAWGLPYCKEETELVIEYCEIQR